MSDWRGSNWRDVRHFPHKTGLSNVDEAEPSQMCRLLGVVSSETTTYGFSLKEAPKSLAALSREHPDGWGLAVHAQGRGWSVQRHAACAGEDHRFDDLAGRAEGEVLIAHIRKKTVGPTRVENTHPFHRGTWVFAHNGTIRDLSRMQRGTSASRAAEVEGDTDSERYFAHLLTLIDEAGGDRARERGALVGAVHAMIDDPSLTQGGGGANFLLGDGHTLYAFRLGRTLHVLDRNVMHVVRRQRTSPETSAALETPWSQRRHAYLVASEQVTDEPWKEIPTATLVAITAGPRPRFDVLVGAPLEP